MSDIRRYLTELRTFDAESAERRKLTASLSLGAKETLSGGDKTLWFDGISPPRNVITLLALDRITEGTLLISLRDVDAVLFSANEDASHDVRGFGVVRVTIGAGKVPIVREYDMGRQIIPFHGAGSLRVELVWRTYAFLATEPDSAEWPDSITVEASFVPGVIIDEDTTLSYLLPKAGAIGVSDEYLIPDWAKSLSVSDITWELQDETSTGWSIPRANPWATNSARFIELDIARNYTRIRTGAELFSAIRKHGRVNISQNAVWLSYGQDPGEGLGTHPGNGCLSFFSRGT